MPTLLQINVVANQGSTGKIAEQIGNMALQKGWRSVIAYGRWPRESSSELIRVGNDFDMKMHALESRIRDNHGLCSRAATRKLIKQIEEIKPDIIHLHNIHGYYLNYKILFDFLKSYNKPVVWTLHDCWSFTGHCSYFDYIGCDKWKSHCQDCKQKKEYPARWFIDRSHKNFEDKKRFFSSLENLTLVPVSNWLAGNLRKSFLKDYPIKVIHNGIDLSVFHPRESGCGKVFKILGVTNRWDRRKGIEDIVKLRNILPSEYQITLVGMKEKRFLPLPEGIADIPRTNNQQELAVLYAESDVLINPTYEDTFPTTNLEALASGIPVITYNTGGSPESITPKTGIVVERGNVQSLADSIINLRQSRLSCKDCRKHAEEFFNKDNCFIEYFNLYSELLK